MELGGKMEHTYCTLVLAIFTVKTHCVWKTYKARKEYGHLLRVAHVVGSANQRCVGSQIP